MASALKVWIFFGITFVTCVGTPTNIYDALQPLGCGQFLAILNNCSYEVKQQYRETRRWTVFAPNDTAFNNLPPSRRSALLRMTTAESERFIKSFTLNKELLTSYFRESEPEQSLSTYTSLIFLTKRVRRGGDTASGLIGPTEYYANGAMLLKPNIQAGSSIIHIVDRVLEVPADKTILGYISQQGQADQPDTAYYTQILSRIVGENYDMTVQPLNNNQLRMTVFIPTQDALARIPADKMQILLSNPEKMNKVARQHVIKNEVLYTSFLYHNEGHNAMGEGQIIFRKNMAREAVFVNSGGVTAQIVRGNITCTNGAVHFIDTLLEYVYNTARDEIDITPQTQQFEDLLSQTRTDVEKIFVNPLGVTVFVPINDAFVNLPSFYNLYNNQSLINRVVELSLLEQGTRYPVTTVNGDYAARRTLVSQYYRRPVIIYSQGNETWVESGYVKARVVRPDIAVTNGFVHFIDAVPGAPSRDVPNTIFCEDWLIKSSLQLKVTGLNNFMRDTRLNKLAPCTTTGGVRASPNVYSNNYNNVPGQGGSSTLSACGGHCRFTIFIPNGTAIEFFENREAGQYIQHNVQRWQYVLSRHITRKVIYFDQTPIGQDQTFRALNGDLVIYRRATPFYAYLLYRGKRAEVLHFDLGATNGVVHIINEVIFDSDDLYRTDFSWTGRAARHFMPHVVLWVLFMQVAWHWLTV